MDSVTWVCKKLVLAQREIFSAAAKASNQAWQEQKIFKVGHKTAVWREQGV